MSLANVLFGTLLGGLLMAVPGSASAVPGTYTFVEDPRCDTHSITLTHELGVKPPFPDDEAIAAGAAPVPLPFSCPGAINDLLIPDFVITITNLTGIAWTDLFFVADLGVSVGNSDGKIKLGDAFKIDTIGVNMPLMSESLLPDLVFEVGETWTFAVIDWSPTLPGAIPTFGSIGVGEDSVGDSGSWASIVAIAVPDMPPVPEPGSLPLAALALGALAFARRHGRVSRANPTSRSPGPLR